MAVELLRTVRSEASGPLAAQPETFRQHKDELNGLLAYRLSPASMQGLFLSQMPFFFVKGDFSRLRSRIDPIHQELKQASLAMPGQPSKPDLTALSVNGALSLFSILRLHLVSQYLRAALPALSSLVHEGAAPLIAPGSVIPSLRHVDPTYIAQLRAEHGGSERDLISSMNRYLEGLTDVDRGEFKMFPHFFFSEKLQKGPPLRGGMKHFRVTTACAMAICHAFTGLRDHSELHEQADMLIPEDETLGPGKGKYTLALLPNNGNQIYYQG